MWCVLCYVCSVCTCGGVWCVNIMYIIYAVWCVWHAVFVVCVLVVGWIISVCGGMCSCDTWSVYSRWWAVCTLCIIYCTCWGSGLLAHQDRQVSRPGRGVQALPHLGEGYWLLLAYACLGRDKANSGALGMFCWGQGPSPMGDEEEAPRGQAWLCHKPRGLHSFLKNTELFPVPH